MTYVNSYGSVDPTQTADYGQLFTGYTLPFKRLGAPTSIQTANQIADVEARLKEGMSTIEMGALSPEVFDQIPKQQFKEMNQLAKLTNAEITVHGPIIDPSGFTDRGWSEQAREEAERHLLDVIKQSHVLNPKGNVPVTIHASSIPSEEWRTITGADKKPLHIKDQMVVINQETGDITAMKREKYISPGMMGPIDRSPEDRLESVNHTEWQNHLVNIQNALKAGEEIMLQAPREGEKIYKEIMEGLEKSNITSKEELERYNEKIKKKISELPEEKRKAYEQFENRLQTADMYYDDAHTRFRTLYEWAYKYPAGTKGKTSEEIKDLEKTKAGLNMISKLWYDNRARMGRPEVKKEIINMSLQLIKQIPATPEMYVPVAQFALEKAPLTVGNVAWKAYKSFGEHTPIIAIENVLPNMAFSTAETLSELIKESKKKFVENAVNAGMNERKAEQAAEKTIGATWDTAHINLLRKRGYSEKEIIGETKKIAPYIKKVHLTDNFGMEHADLPPGMGTAPLKKKMQEIEAAGFTGKSIVEAGSFVAQFKVSPTPYSLEALGSPIYGPLAGGPVWSQSVGTYGSANLGYGLMFPEQHYSMYGGGFSSLPLSMGGQVPGKQSRFSGAPME